MEEVLHKSRIVEEKHWLELGINNSFHDDFSLYDNFKPKTSFLDLDFSSRCMHFYGTCPLVICTHNIPNVIQKWVKFKSGFHPQILQQCV